MQNYKITDLFSNLQDSFDNARWPEALHLIDTLMRDDIEVPACLHYLASYFLKLKKFSIGKFLYEKAIELKPGVSAFHNNLGYANQQLNFRKEAARHFKIALKLQPENEITLLGNIAACYVACGTPDKGLKYTKEALDKGVDDSSINNNHALCHLEKGNYKEGWKYYDARRKKDDMKEKSYGNLPEYQYWDGTKGQTIVVFGEQGIGDEIMFASMLEDVRKEANVIFDCNDRLLNLFRNSFPDLTIYGTKQRSDKEIIWPSTHKIDAKIPIGSLAKFYRNKEQDFPKTAYLKAEGWSLDKWKEKLSSLGSKPKIGFSWYGGVRHTDQYYRYIDLKLWKEIFTLDADFISLQYNDDAKEELDKFCKENGYTNIHHWKEAVYDFDETSGLVSNLDFVISAPQSVVHLAGGLGVPTYQLTPKQAMWQMGPYGKDMPWYGSVTNIWQPSDGDWKSVLKKVKGQLCNLFPMIIKD